MKKRILFLVLIAVVLLLVACNNTTPPLDNGTADGTTSGTTTGENQKPIVPNSDGSEGLAFVSNGDGTCYVSGIGTCTDTDVVIPEVSPDGDYVTKIGTRAFRKCTELTSISLPDSVTSIDDLAFDGCTGLTSITIRSG